MDKIIVTGGVGYIGSVLLPLLLEKGYFVKVIDSCIYRQNVLLECFRNKNFEFIKKDIRELEKEDIKDFDFIIHLAAIVGEPACKKDKTLCYEINRDATKKLTDLCDNQKIIYASSGSVYGKVEGVCTEETSTSPLGDYGISKLQAEKIIENSELEYIVYRFATAFGGSARIRFDLLINDFVYRAIKYKNIVLYEPKARRTFIHSFDFAHSLIFAVENFEKMKNEIYNVGNEKNNIEKGKIAELIKTKVDFTLAYSDYMKDPDQRDYEVSYEKIKKKGLKTIYSVEDGIDELIKIVKIINIYNPFNL